MKDELMIYPNPVVEMLHIDYPERAIKIKVFDINGQLVINKIISESSIDVSELLPGIYFLELEGFRDTYSTKFIKINSR
jgi:hypothetical protein